MEKGRQHFRIEYPKTDRPTLLLNNEAHSIINLSERGMLFSFKEVRLNEGDLINGTVIFNDKETVAISGKVVRKDDKNNIALHLANSISFQRIITEQRLLIKKYGTLKQPEEVKKED